MHGLRQPADAGCRLLGHTLQLLSWRAASTGGQLIRGMQQVSHTDATEVQWRHAAATTRAWSGLAGHAAGACCATPARRSRTRWPRLLGVNAVLIAGVAPAAASSVPQPLLLRRLAAVAQLGSQLLQTADGEPVSSDAVACWASCSLVSQELRARLATRQGHRGGAATAAQLVHNLSLQRLQILGAEPILPAELLTLLLRGMLGRRAVRRSTLPLRAAAQVAHHLQCKVGRDAAAAWPVMPCTSNTLLQSEAGDGAASNAGSCCPCPFPHRSNSAAPPTPTLACWCGEPCSEPPTESEAASDSSGDTSCEA